MEFASVHEYMWLPDRAFAGAVALRLESCSWMRRDSACVSADQWSHERVAHRSPTLCVTTHRSISHERSEMKSSRLQASFGALL